MLGDTTATLVSTESAVKVAASSAGSRHGVRLPISGPCDESGSTNDAAR